jgi:hypothetical protein
VRKAIGVGALHKGRFDMSWKVARWGLALALCAVVVAGARADEDEKPKEKKKEIKIKLPEAHAKCAKACQECIKACGEAAKLCGEKYKEGEKKYLPPFRWMQDCAQSCQLVFVVVIRNGPGLKLVCEACAKICDECAKACKDFEDGEMKECVKQCEACAKACREMIKGQKKEKKKEEKDDEKKEKTAKLELAAPKDVTLKPGGEVKVTLKVTRTNVDGEITVKFSDLPKGVAVADKTPEIKAGANSGTFTLKAADDAEAVKGHVVTVKLSAAQGKLALSQAFKVTIEAKD